MMDKLMMVVIFASVLFMMPDQFEGKPLTKEEIKNITAQCLNESNFDQAILNKAVRKQKLPDYDSNYGKQLLCTYKKQGYVNDEGEIDFAQLEDFLADYYEKADLVNIIKACEAGQKGETQEEKTYSVATCLIDNLHELEKRQGKS